MTDDDDLLRLLHATTAPNAPAGANLAGVAMVRGKRIRRRRATVATLGSALTVAAFATALVVMPHGGDATAVIPAGPTTTPTPSSRLNNTQILLDGLGPDFQVGGSGSQGQVEVVPGSPSAKELPDGYHAVARLAVLPTRPAGVSAAEDTSDLPPLPELCAQSQEKGSQSYPCRTVQLADGRTVQVQDERTVIGDYQPYGARQAPGTWDETTVYYQRPDDSIVRTELIVYDSADTSTPNRQKVADAWLPRWTPALEGIAADPRIGPPPGPATNHPATTPQQLLAQQENSALQQALGSGFDLIDGTVELEFGSALEGELPDRRYSARADVTHLEPADMQKACGPDLSGCRTITLPDGAKAYAITTAQPWTPLTRAATAPDGSTVTPDPAGSAGIDLRTTVYEPQPDGQVIATAVELVSNVPMTSAEQADQTPDDKAWLQALQPRLARAAGDIAAQQATRPTPARTP